MENDDQRELEEGTLEWARANLQLQVESVLTKFPFRQRPYPDADTADQDEGNNADQIPIVRILRGQLAQLELEANTTLDLIQSIVQQTGALRESFDMRLVSEARRELKITASASKDPHKTRRFAKNRDALWRCGITNFKKILTAVGIVDVTMPTLSELPDTHDGIVELHGGTRGAATQAAWYLQRAAKTVAWIFRQSAGLVSPAVGSMLQVSGNLLVSIGKKMSGQI